MASGAVHGARPLDGLFPAPVRPGLPHLPQDGFSAASAASQSRALRMMKSRAS